MYVGLHRTIFMRCGECHPRDNLHTKHSSGFHWAVLITFTNIDQSRNTQGGADEGSSAWAARAEVAVVTNGDGKRTRLPNFSVALSPPLLYVTGSHRPVYEKCIYTWCVCACLTYIIHVTDRD